MTIENDTTPDPHDQIAAQTGSQAVPGRPGITGYVVGGLLITLAVGWFVYALVSGLLGIDDRMQYVPVPGTATITVDEPGDTVIYVETTGEIDGSPYTFTGSTSDLGITITGPEGNTVPIGTPGFTGEYSIPGHTGHSLASFDAPAAGRYEIATTIGGSTEGPPRYTLAVGSMGIVEILLLSFAAGIPLLIGIAVIIVTARRRSTRRP